MAGSLPGSNSTSTTGPMTWTILPWLMRRSSWLRFDGLAKRFRSTDDIQELLRDPLLAGLVVLDGQEVDHVAGVLGRGFHGRHAGAVLARHRLHERTVHLRGHVPRKQRSQDRLRPGLVDVLVLRFRIRVAFTLAFADLRCAEWQELLP